MSLYRGACIAMIFISIHSVHAQKLLTRHDSLSYAGGVSMAQVLIKQGIDSLNLDLFLQAFKQNIGKDSLAIAVKDAEKIFNKYLIGLKSEEGERFHANNATRKGVVTLPSGLQYEVISKSEKNRKPKLEDSIKAHYVGYLINGTVFDSSIKRGEPATFQLLKVIQGWIEGLQLMSLGDKYRFFIPYQLAYGEKGIANTIPPYSTLIFEVELLEINGSPYDQTTTE